MPLALQNDKIPSMTDLYNCILDCSSYAYYKAKQATVSSKRKLLLF